MNLTWSQGFAHDDQRRWHVVATLWAEHDQTVTSMTGPRDRVVGRVLHVPINESFVPQTRGTSYDSDWVTHRACETLEEAKAVCVATIKLEAP